MPIPSNLAGLDLNLLVALHALLEERNVTRAGRRVGLSQSAMSGSLARLRTVLEDPLLVRVGRGLQLSPRARLLVDPVRALIEQIRQVLGEERRFDPTTDRRRFLLAISDYGSLLLMPHLLEVLEREAPRVTLETVPLYLNTLRRLDAGKLDLVLWPFEAGPRYCSQIVFRDQWICAMWAGAPEPAGGLTRDTYNRMPHLGVPLAHGSFQARSGEHLERSGLQGNVRATATSLLIAPHILRGTPLVAFLPYLLARRFERSAELRLMAPPIEPLELEYRLTWSHSTLDDSANVWLRRKIEDAASKLESEALPSRPRDRRKGKTSMRARPQSGLRIDR
jgi:DNA-binding transcriptional LysR family regulator